MWGVVSCKGINKLISRCVSVEATAPIQLDRGLILSKLTRYEVEQYRHPGLNESQLERAVGSNYESIVDRHARYKTYERYIVDVFNKTGITTRTVNRLEYSEELLNWCDAVFPVGGDGTFLLAASRVAGDEKPVIGFNSDPASSEGFLCLPKRYSDRAEDALCKLFNGEFRWMFRNRIRMKLYSDEASVAPLSLHYFGQDRTEVLTTNKVLQEMNTSFSRLPFDVNNFPNKRCVKIGKCSILPVLALNEVFVGENLSAQASYLELRTSPDDVIAKVKSSGICVSTGSGSTSWHLSMNRITRDSVEKVLNCAGIEAADFSEIAKRYNDSLAFRPDDPRLCYVVREMIWDDVWPNPPGLAPRGFTERLWIRSHCQDGSIVIDGGTSYPFNDGAVVVLESHPEDALRTVEII